MFDYSTQILNIEYLNWLAFLLENYFFVCFTAKKFTNGSGILYWNFEQSMGARNPSRNRVVVPARQCCNLRTIFGGYKPNSNRVVVPARQATSAGGFNSLESIPELLKSFWSTLQSNLDLCIPRKVIERPQSQFPHSLSCSRIGRSIRGIYKSLTETWIYRNRIGYRI